VDSRAASIRNFLEQEYVTIDGYVTKNTGLLLSAISDTIQSRFPQTSAISAQLLNNILQQAFGHSICFFGTNPNRYVNLRRKTLKDQCIRVLLTKQSMEFVDLMTILGGTITWRVDY